jgi:uncharacterized BrkB/YihY/UPF0761 family membrane protein
MKDILSRPIYNAGYHFLGSKPLGGGAIRVFPHSAASWAVISAIESLQYAINNIWQWKEKGKPKYPLQLSSFWAFVKTVLTVRKTCKHYT